MSNNLPVEPTPGGASAVAASPTAPPAYPDGAEVSVRAKPHDAIFWDQHPALERYRLIASPGRPKDDWTVLLWFKPGALAEMQDREASATPDRAADLDLTFSTTHDVALLTTHPNVLAYHSDLQVTEYADGAERRLRLWLVEA